MSGIALRGLNWNHRRAAGPIAAATRRFAAAHPGVSITWESQELSGFQHGLGRDLAARYDVVVFDHPACGTIARDGLLRPLDDELAGLRDVDFIGRSLESYRYAGSLWALPIDGAAQVAVYRPDLLAAHGAVPHCWDAVIALGRAVRADGRWLGLACHGPHGFLAIMALCASLGRPWSLDPWAEACDRRTLATALDALRALLEYVHPDCLGLNAIGVHDAMGTRDDIVYCPIAFGYLTYAEADHPRVLRFADFPGPGAQPAAGAVLGGAGLGLTAGCRDPALAAELLTILAGGPAQCELVAGHHGQPGHVAAWNDAAIDARFGGAFTATRASMATAWVRPRFPGYPVLNHACGAATAAFLARDITADALIGRLARLWHELAPPMG